MFPIVAALIDGDLGFVERYDLTWMNQVYTEIVNKVLFSRRRRISMENELVRLPPEIWKLKSVVENTFAPHRSSGVFPAEVSSSRPCRGQL